MYSLLRFIQGKIQSEGQSSDDRIHELHGYEKTLYCLERLSQQINIDGFENFFDYYISNLYADILEALSVVQAHQIAGRLRDMKHFLLGDSEATRENINDIDWSLYDKEQLESLSSREAEDDFHEKFKAYALACFEKEGFALAD